MKQVNISSILCLCVLINLLFPGCTKVQQPKPELRLPKLENAQAYNNRGNAYFEKGQYDLAISDYSEAIAIDPKNAAAYSNRGDIYLLKGQYDATIADFSNVIEINPKLSVFYYLRGNAYFKKKDFANTWNDYNKAQELGFIIPPEVLEKLRQDAGKKN